MRESLGNPVGNSLGIPGEKVGNDEGNSPPNFKSPYQCGHSPVSFMVGGLMVVLFSGDA